MSEKPKIRHITSPKAHKRGEREPGVLSRPSDFLSRLGQPEALRWVILIPLCLIISLLLFPNILSPPEFYILGDVADMDIKASRDFLIEDKERTEKAREKEK